MFLKKYANGSKDGRKWFYIVDNPNQPQTHLQYNISTDSIINLDIDTYVDDNNIDIDEFYDGWTLAEHSKENLLRLTPNTNGIFERYDWKLIMVIKKYVENGTWIKGAIQNKTTGQITLTSSFNKEDIEYNGKSIESKYKDWRICQTCMIVPLFFWSELKNRLVN
jgi:hypothetical protein